MSLKVRAFIRKYIVSFNFLILIVFTFQNASSVLLSSYTQQRYADGDAHKRYTPMHMLMAVEMCKLFFSLLWICYDIMSELKNRTRTSLGSGVDGDVSSVLNPAGLDANAPSAKEGLNHDSVCDVKDIDTISVSVKHGADRAGADHGVAKRGAGSPVHLNASYSFVPHPITEPFTRQFFSRFQAETTLLYCRPVPMAGSRRGCLAWLQSHVNVEAFLMAVPAVAYAVQNLFILDALSKLSPIGFQIAFQLRILMMAVAMRVIMKTAVSAKRWLALVILFIGVVLGQLGAATDEKKHARQVAAKAATTMIFNTDVTTTLGTVRITAFPSITREGPGVALPLEEKAQVVVSLSQRAASALTAAAAGDAASAGTTAAKTDANIKAALAARTRFLSGLSSLFIGCCISILSAVYMEAVFKKRSRNAFLSTRNIHLAFFSILYLCVLAAKEYGQLQMAYADVQDREVAFTKGPVVTLTPKGTIYANGKIYYESFGSYVSNFFMNFDVLVWTLVCVNAFGGLLIALIMRYSDNIMKTMSTAAAIVLSGVGSYLIFDTQIGMMFTLGALLVLAAVLMYNLA